MYSKYGRSITYRVWCKLELDVVGLLLLLSSYRGFVVHMYYVGTTTGVVMGKCPRSFVCPPVCLPSCHTMLLTIFDRSAPAHIPQYTTLPAGKWSRWARQSEGKSQLRHRCPAIRSQWILSLCKKYRIRFIEAIGITYYINSGEGAFEDHDNHRLVTGGWLVGQRRTLVLM